MNCVIGVLSIATKDIMFATKVRIVHSSQEDLKLGKLYRETVVTIY